jgi:hypothetical protein
MLVSSNSSQSYPLFESKTPSQDDQPTVKQSQDNSSKTQKDEIKESNSTTEKNNPTELTSAERQQVTELKQRDSEVRAHEAAHISAGGSAVSGAASYTYQKGPDGQLYAVGGEGAISAAGANSPEEKLALAKQMRAGALAPANPSPQDIKVASSAAQMEAQARQEIAKQDRDEQQQEKEKNIATYADEQNNVTDVEPSLNIVA